MPRRWPTVKWTTPRCCPSTLPWTSTISPGASVSGRVGQFDYAAEIKNRSLSSRPETWDITSVGFENPTGQVAERKAQEVELLGGRAIQEVALVAAGIGALVKLGPATADDPTHIVTRGEAIRAQLAREGDQVGELHALIAQRARHRRAPARIFIDEPVDHPCPEAAFVVEHVMGDAEAFGDHLGIVDVLPCAARARSSHRLAMIVKLERDADHLGAGPRGERGRD